MKHDQLIAMLLSQRQTYDQKVINVIGRSSIVGFWLLDEKSGTVATDCINGLIGTYVGSPTMGVAGIGDGKTCLTLDGANDYVNILSAGLLSRFSGDEGTAIIWIKQKDATVWTDSAEHYAFMLRVDSNNSIRIRKPVSSGYLEFLRRAGGASLSWTIPITNTHLDWLQLVFTWSKSGDFIKAYINGVLVGLPITGLNSFAGSLATATIGSWDLTYYGKGFIAEYLLANRPLSDAEVANLKFQYPKTTGSMLIQFDDGDSSVYSTCYPVMAARGLKGTAYINSVTIGTGGFMTLAQLQTLYAAGWDIGNHTATHPDMTTLTEAQQETELTTCRDYLNTNGLTRASRHVAYPSGYYNADTITAMANTSMLTGRTASGPLFDPASYADLYHIQSIFNGDRLDLNEMAVGSAKAIGKVYIYFDHNIGFAGTLNATNFTAFMDFIVASGIQTLTITELYARLNP